MSAFSQFARRFYRTYRNGRMRFGHSLLRRLFASMIAEQQEVALRSGLKMGLDLTKGPQNGVFWEDGDAEVQFFKPLPLKGTNEDMALWCGRASPIAAYLHDLQSG